MWRGMGYECILSLNTGLSVDITHYKTALVYLFKLFLKFFHDKQCDFSISIRSMRLLATSEYFIRWEEKWQQADSTLQLA